ncbi:hypothetical protein M2368_001072 [Arthrobacter sp. JUb119]|nr:hypothetical protein [Arthrobacter sp. JUb119]
MGLFKNEAATGDSPFHIGALASQTHVDDVVMEWVP